MARVLFVTPAVPAADRNGLAMRAGVSVEGLHRRHDLTVAVVRSPYDETSFDWVDRHARRVVDTVCVDDRRSSASWLSSERGRSVLASPLPAMVRLRPPSIGDELIDRVGSGFDVVVVMGTFTSGVVVPFLDRGVPAVLDAFDDDARTCASLALLDPTMADEVAPYDAFQRRVLPWYEHVLFAADHDAVAPYLHLPNAVRIPSAPIGPDDDAPFTVVFVGNPAYRPNRDALDRLHEHLLPRLRAAGTPVRLLHPGPDDDVAACYRAAHLAVVPLRAGGGTRIKILEAFAYRCPVVSTATGAAGLGVNDGEHLVITADDDDPSFAAAVAGLAHDRTRRARLAEAAARFVAARHDHRVVGDQLADLVDDVARRSAGPPR